MIPLDQIIDVNLYSQDDAVFLLGRGFTGKAAREAIRSACKSGQLEGIQWRKRWWFTGCAFKAWVKRWFGADTGAAADDGLRPIARVVVSGYDGATDSGPARRGRKGG